MEMEGGILMRTMAVVFLALLVGTAVILLPLQDAQEEMSRPAYTVGVVLKAMDSEHWLAVRSSMQKAAEENHIRLIVMTPENEAAYGEQDQIIEDLLQEGIDALIVSPVNIYHTAQWVEEAQQHGIPLLTIDEKLPGIPYVGSDGCGGDGRAAACWGICRHPRWQREPGCAYEADGRLSGLSAGTHRSASCCCGS